MSRAYLDHASSSPLRPAALDAMLPYLRSHPADPGRPLRLDVGHRAPLHDHPLDPGEAEGGGPDSLLDLVGGPRRLVERQRQLDHHAGPVPVGGRHHPEVHHRAAEHRVLDGSEGGHDRGVVGGHGCLPGAAFPLRA